MIERKKIDLNPLSLTSIPITMYFDETKQKLASATGFIYEKNKKIYLITNWHNLTGQHPETKKQISNHGGIPDTIRLNLIIHENSYFKWGNFTIGLYDEHKRANWLVHPKHKELVDVVALEIKYNQNSKAIFKPINKIHNVEFNDFNLRVSSDVFVLGFPYELKGSGQLPIWKRGSVATEPEIDYEGLPKMYVDTASRIGMSGSPVIFKKTGTHRTIGMPGIKNGTIAHGTVQDFIGVYSGRILGKTELEAQLGIVWKRRVIDEIIDGNIRDEKNMW